MNKAHEHKNCVNDYKRPYQKLVRQQFYECIFHSFISLFLHSFTRSLCISYFPCDLYTVCMWIAYKIQNLTNHTNIHVFVYGIEMEMKKLLFYTSNRNVSRAFVCLWKKNEHLINSMQNSMLNFYTSYAYVCAHRCVRLHVWTRTQRKCDERIRYSMKWEYTFCV